MPSPSSSRTGVLTLVLLAQFMVVLDVSVVNVALPSMRAALGFSDAGLSWVANAYTIPFAGCLLLGGRLADLYGLRATFAAGLGLFGAASLVGGLAPDGGVLIAARALQGLGAAVLAPATLTVLLATFPEGRERARAIGLWTAVGAAGGAAGGLVGGILTEALSWRWVLLVNVPLAVVVVPWALRALAGLATDGRRPRLDVPGAVTVTAGLALVVTGIVGVERAGVGSAQALAPLVTGLAALGLFVLVEHRWAREPLVPLGALRARSLRSANLVMLVSGAALFAVWYFVSLYMQQVLGMSPIATGLGFLPHTLAVIAGSQLSARLFADRDPRAVVAAGLGLAALGFVWLAQSTVDGGYWTHVGGPGIVVMLGAGVALAPTATVATSGVAPALHGLASGLVNTTRMVGGAIGLAALVSLAAGHADGGGVAAVVDGFNLAYWVSAGTVALAALLALRFPAPVSAPAG